MMARSTVALAVALAVALVVALALPAFAQAQSTQTSHPPAILIADSVFVTGENLLIAQGNVEALQGDVRLKAEKITFDQSTGKMTIVGPIIIQQGEDITILADSAELDQDLQNGLLTGARIVLDQQLQLAAVHIAQTSGRYSQLYKSAVTSCRICNDGSPPLWQIRAKQVIHDRQEQQLYFEHAQFRILDVPVFYVPKLRLPDPTLERATGFLIPSVHSNTLLETGVKVPYFIKLGEHKDLTLTPYISPDTRTLEFRYRQAFENGRITFRGAISDDDLRPGSFRGYLNANGAFSLKNDFKLDFGIEAASDSSYLLDYDYSDTDRLVSFVAINRTKRDQYLGARLTNYNSLRDDDAAATQPSAIGNVFYDHRFFPPSIGGELRLGINLHAHYRPSDLDVDGPDDDLIVDGRDVTRLNTEFGWIRAWTFANGLRADTNLGFAVDIFSIQHDANYDPLITQISPYTSLDLRYPMTRTMGNGVVHYLEPVTQIAWVGGSSDQVPNDESTHVEFDDGNLLSLSRFPAPDRRERGLFAAYGVNWSRFDPDGWDARLTVGQVIRDIADNDFTKTSGLSGTSSDFLVAGQIRTKNGFQMTARTLFDQEFEFSKAELRTLFTNKGIRFGGSYTWLTEDAAEFRDEPLSELALAGSFPISRHWRAKADWRYDITNTDTTRAGATLSYNNECVTVDLSVKRRFTSSSSVEPSTSFGFTIALRGFSVNTGTETYARSCGN